MLTAPKLKSWRFKVFWLFLKFIHAVWFLRCNIIFVEFQNFLNVNNIEIPCIHNVTCCAFSKRSFSQIMSFIDLFFIVSFSKTYKLRIESNLQTSRLFYATQYLLPCLVIVCYYPFVPKMGQLFEKIFVY